MMQESLINSPLLAALAITLIHFLWQGALVALVLKNFVVINFFSKIPIALCVKLISDDRLFTSTCHHIFCHLRY